MAELIELFSYPINEPGLHADILLKPPADAGRGAGSLRFNPYHDELGKFATGPGAGASTPGATVSAGSPAVHLDKIFSTADMSLPLNGRNDMHTKDELFATAAKVLGEFDTCMDHGDGVDKALGGYAIRPGSGDEFLNSLRKEGPPVVVIAPLKGGERAESKVNSKYRGDWGKLTDAVRGTVAVDKVADLPKTLRAVKDQFDKAGFKLAMRPEDRLSNPAPGGYRDAVLKFRNEKGVICEVLISTKRMILEKQTGGHKLLEERRVIEESAIKEGRQLSEAEAAKVHSLNSEMEQLYGNAWRASGGK